MFCLSKKPFILFIHIVQLGVIGMSYNAFIPLNKHAELLYPLNNHSQSEKLSKPAEPDQSLPTPHHNPKFLVV